MPKDLAGNINVLSTENVDGSDSESNSEGDDIDDDDDQHISSVE